jgi:ABC-type dipeptide/oligopeptide/nickel transport system permease component
MKSPGKLALDRFVQELSLFLYDIPSFQLVMLLLLVVILIDRKLITI